MFSILTDDCCHLPGSAARGDLRLQAQDVTVFYADIGEALAIEQLLAGGAVMELVAERLTVGGGRGETHFLEQDRKDSLNRRIQWHFHLLALVSRRIPDLNRHHPHELSPHVPWKPAPAFLYRITPVRSKPRDAPPAGRLRFGESTTPCPSGGKENRMANSFRLILCLAVVLIAASSAQAVWWDEAWPYRRAAKVTWRDDRGSGVELAQAVIYTAGYHREDGGDIRVATLDGRLVPHEVLKVGPGDQVAVAWQLRKGQREYFVYFGHKEPPELPGDLDAFVPTGGLRLETRRWDRQGDQPKQLQKSFERCEPVLGRTMIEQAFIGFNPNTEERQTISQYRGTLFAPLDGEYTFAMAADDRGALYIDDKLIVEAQGAPGDIRFNSKINLTRGQHDFVVYHADFGGETRLSVGWQRPDQSEVSVIPKDAFGLLYPADVGALEHNKQRLVADFTVEYLGETFFENDFAHRVRFTAPETRGVTYEWDLGDGVRGRGASVEHVYLRGGVFPVRLVAKSSQQSDTQTTRIHIARDYTLGNKPRTFEPPEISEMVAGYDVSRMEAAMLVRAVQLHHRAEHYDPMLHAAEALAKREKHPNPRLAMQTLSDVTRDALLKGRGDRAVAVMAAVPAKSNLQPQAAELLGEYLLWWRADPAGAVRALEPYQAEHESARRAYGHALVLRGDVDKGRAVLEGLPIDGEPQKRPAISGAMARTVEYFISVDEWDAGEGHWSEWQAKFPADFLEGYSMLLRAQLMALRGFEQQAAAVAAAFANAVPESSYAPRLLHYASHLYQDRNPDQSRALLILLRERYPEDPLAQ